METKTALKTLLATLEMTQTYLAYVKQVLSNINTLYLALLYAPSGVRMWFILKSSSHAKVLKRRYALELQCKQSDIEVGILILLNDIRNYQLRELVCDIIMPYDSENAEWNVEGKLNPDKMIANLHQNCKQLKRLQVNVGKKV